VDRWPAGLDQSFACEQDDHRWVDETSLHVVLDGIRLKTLPSRLGVTELARLAADGARPAGPSPLLSGIGTPVEVERMVNTVRPWGARGWRAGQTCGDGVKLDPAKG
jgi:hypothetical protein